MMKHNILILLKSFTKKDLKTFSKFLASPYFNTNNAVVRLFKDIIRFYPNFTHTKLSREKIYSRIYKKDKYNDSTMRNLLFRLEQLIKSYLIIENFSNNYLSENNNLLEELNLRLLKEPFIKESKKLECIFSSFVGTDNNYFYNRYVHEVNKFNFYTIHGKKTSQKQINSQLDILEKANIHLTIFFITEIICNYLNTITYQQRFKSLGRTDFINSLVNSLNVRNVSKLVSGEVDHDFILEIYLNLLECFTNFNREQYYYDYKSSIDMHSSKLSADEMSFHYSRLINYCIWKQNYGDKKEEFKFELFNIYNVFLEKEYYKNKKTQYLPQNLFRAILFLGLSLEKFTWCKGFIDKYCESVEPQHKENMMYFGLCFYYFHIGKYEKSLEYAEHIVNEYFIFKFDINCLLVRINFILYNPEEIYRIIHKYTEALREDKFLPKDMKEAHHNFISYCHKLVESMEDKKRIEIGLVRKKLIKCTNIILKEWLLKEYDKIIKVKESNTAS